MRREADARSLLDRLLDRHERSSGGRRIIERPPQTFARSDDLRRLTESLQAAMDAGAVALVWDRAATHLVDQVVLVDPGALYAHLQRTPIRLRVEHAISRLSEIGAVTVPGRGLLDDISEGWGRGAKVAGLGHDDLDEARNLVAAMDAVFAELPPDVPLRTRSARLLGDSKALERSLPAIIAYLRQSGSIDAEASREEALAALGLSRFLQPVLVAGTIRVDGNGFSRWPYVGIPPEMAARVEPMDPIRTLLTIENLESFNRHVRSAILPGDIVVYAGGFPSAAVIGLLRALLPGCRLLHHWGDLDPGGIRIGRYLETTLGCPVRPHRMEISLARSMGRAPPTGQRAPQVPAESGFFEHAAYLSNPTAPWLEQEVVDPVTVQPS